jgi:hypothetical protein
LKERIGLTVALPLWTGIGSAGFVPMAPHVKQAHDPNLPLSGPSDAHFDRRPLCRLPFGVGKSSFCGTSNSCA